jgi:nitrile hydratase
MSFLLLELFQYDVQLVETVGPQLLVLGHPVVDGLERSTVQAVEPAPSVLADGNRAHLAEDAEVLGDERLNEAELGDEVVHRVLAAGEDVEDLTPPRLRHGIERIGRRRCSCHDPQYISISEYVKRDDRIGPMERAVHDRGGWPTDAPIDRMEHDLADWEMLVDAIVGALGGRGVMNVDELRRGIEDMPAERYESASYYERWLHSVESNLVQKGVLEAGELDAWLAG